MMTTQNITVNVNSARARTCANFFHAMENGMAEHDDDRVPVTWRGDDPLELMEHLHEEAMELLSLIEEGGASKDDILKEASDVANLSMMVADAMGALPR